MDITVLLATYNRSSVLKITLESFCQLDTEGLNVEFVVIDNNSTDDTKNIVSSFTDKLKVKYLFEPTTGKSFALNKALKEITLGNIVVFTDDDVTPDKNWLRDIYQITWLHPDVLAFGGRIFTLWETTPPQWLTELAKNNFYSWAYAYHDLGDNEIYYSIEKVPNEPFGPNFWVRKELLQDGRCFDQRIGPTNSMSTRIMGEDTHFVQKIQKDGYKILYYPATVQHRIQPGQMTMAYLRERALTIGRTRAVSSPFKMPGLYKTSKALWLLLRFVFCIIGIIKRLPGLLQLNKSKRYAAVITLYRRIGYDIFYIRNAAAVWELTKIGGNK